jgi:hypothetical protein
MKAILSTTYDDQYLFYLPITTWCWNKLGVEVICFAPVDFDNKKLQLIKDVTCFFNDVGRPLCIQYFIAAAHKEATYAQCSRLYAAALDLPEDEVLITSDIDMAVFNLSEPMKKAMGDFINIVGYDLVPEKQVPMCYLVGNVDAWRKAFNLNGESYQQKLDSLLGEIECESFRGNYWGKDQEEAFNNLYGERGKSSAWRRARPGTQFATHRIDRDDAFFMDRLTPDVIDYHMHRPGYTDENFEKILAVIKYFYPFDNLDWMREYQQQYKALL